MNPKEWTTNYFEPSFRTIIIYRFYLFAARSWSRTKDDKVIKSNPNLKISCSFENRLGFRQICIKKNYFSISNKLFYNYQLFNII